MRQSMYPLLLVLFAASGLFTACGGGGGSEVAATAPSAVDEQGFRELRQDFHTACTTGDAQLLESRWSDDAMLTTPAGATFVGEDAVEQITTSPTFGTLLVLTPEASWWVIMRGDQAEYGFESVSIDIGGGDPSTTWLAPQFVQNPDVEIVEHTHSIGQAVRGRDGRWVFQELTIGNGPLPPAPSEYSQLLAEGGFVGLPFAVTDDELGFQRMRQDFHLANTIGDAELMRTVWADDAVFRGGPNEIFGGDAITTFFANGENFGQRINLTPEHSSRIAVNGNDLEYAFECVSLSLGGLDPKTTPLAIGGAQNPAVEIVWHSNSQGRAVRTSGNRWAFLEFNGGQGPLPSNP